MNRLVIAFAALALSAPAQALAGSKPPKLAPVEGAWPLPEGWKVTFSEAGGFALAFPPGEPKFEEQTLDTEAGKIVARALTLETGKGGPVYSAIFNDFPKDSLVADPQVLLDGARDGVLENVKGALKSEKKINVDGHPGRELVIESPRGFRWHMRVVLSKERLVQAIVAMPAGEDDLVVIRAFLDSLRVRPKI